MSPPGWDRPVGILPPSATLRSHQTPEMPPTAAATRTRGYAIVGNCRDPEWNRNGTETVQTADPIMAIASLPISPNEPGVCALADCDSASKHHDSWRYPPRGRRGASPDPSLGATDDVVATTPPPRNPSSPAMSHPVFSTPISTNERLPPRGSARDPILGTRG